MTTLTLPWLSSGLAVALGAALAVRTDATPARRRVEAIVVESVLLALSLLPLIERLLRPDAGTFFDPLWPALVADGLSVALLPLGASLGWGCMIAAPRADCRAGGLRRHFLGQAAVFLAFAAGTPTVLGAAWILSIVVFLFELRAQIGGRALRIAGLYLGSSALAVAAGAVCLFHIEGARRLGLGLILVGLLIRKGIFPFHGWVPEVFEHGRLIPALLFSAPQLAALLVLRWFAPQADPRWLHAIGILALVTSVYGAGCFLFARDARRALGFFFMSQSALVMAGIVGQTGTAVVGGLCLWLTSSAALTGIGVALRLLEVRRGRLALDRHHGGYENQPLLAVTFLLLGLASVGFPGTLGFIAQELLIEGETLEFPYLGFAAVIAITLNGIGLLRVYFSLFCGQGPGPLGTRLGGREMVSTTALVLALLLGGLLPGTIVRGLSKVVDNLHLSSGLR